MKKGYQVKTIIKKYMREKGLTVRDLAKKANLSPSVIQDIKNGSDLKISSLIKITKVLGLSIWIDDGLDGYKLK